jgi:branched-chain amino acid transport system permease protein
MAFGPHLLLAALEGLVGAAVLALTALGLSLVFGVMRVVNVAHGEFFMLGAVLAWAVSSLFPGHPAIGFVAALVVSPLAVAAIALLAERLILRPLNYDPEGTIVATIGLLYVIQQAALTLYGPEARPVEAPFNVRIVLPWFGYSGYKLSVIAASAVLIGLTWLVLTRTRIGLVMRATQLLAAVLIGLADGIISVFFSPTLAKIIATLLVALVLVFRPQGLFGTTPR